MTDLLEVVFSATFLITVIRASTPLLFATLGGLISDLGGALNVALEGMMLIAALTAVVVSVYAPWYVGVVAGMGAGAALGAIMALFHLRYKADVILVGFAVNILAAGGTVFALSLATGGDKGTSINLQSKAIPSIDIPAFEGIPVLNFFTGHSALSWLAALSVAGIWYFLYRTPRGMWLRGVGEYPAAPEAAGIGVNAVRAWSLVASGALAGLGGAQLAMFNYIGFTRDMTAGRGFIALGAVLLGARHPVGAMLAALLFGLFEALSIVMPGIFSWIPGELVQTIPFVVTLLALILFSYRTQRAERTLS
ncbi:ABC transporter permease [Flavimaricola marinus]|uniref:Branched-chain amino acid transport system / permease component n=1 Tax=Flavimaricola marinus TaxID=1819565 RepID=A0A238LDX2_9RHOB|nr:ABC transporter permease [Flavimaricola marinus]SMY07130.1 Branched-chain amino acid transport system / permease component [Flavimaricola marinus]